MDLGTRVGEVVAIDLAQQHRAFDSLGLRQLHSLSFGELKQGPTDAASLRVTVTPPPVFDEFPGPLHGFVFDKARSDLRPEDEDFATFLAAQAPRTRVRGI